MPLWSQMSAMRRRPLLVHQLKLLGVRPGVKSLFRNKWAMANGPCGDLIEWDLDSLSQMLNDREREGHKITGRSQASIHMIWDINLEGDECDSICIFGVYNVHLFTLGLLSPQRNWKSFLWKFNKSVLTRAIGKVQKRYRILGRIFIFIECSLPNHDGLWICSHLSLPLGA